MCLVVGEGGFSLISNNYARFRTNSRSDENRLFRVNVHVQLSKRSNFSPDEENIITVQIFKHTTIIAGSRNSAIWTDDDDAIVTVNSSVLVELEDQDELRVYITSDPAASNARIDVFDWTIVEVT